MDFSQKGVYKLTFEGFILSNFFFVAISPLRGYFCKIMCNGQQAELNFNLLKPTKMEPLEVLVVLEVSKYGFHILRSLAAIFQAFIREQFSRSLSLIFLRRWFTCTILSDRLL